MEIIEGRTSPQPVSSAASHYIQKNSAPREAKPTLTMCYPFSPFPYRHIFRPSVYIPIFFNYLPQHSLYDIKKTDTPSKIAMRIIRARKNEHMSPLISSTSAGRVKFNNHFKEIERQYRCNKFCPMDANKLAAHDPTCYKYTYTEKM